MWVIFFNCWLFKLSLVYHQILKYTLRFHFLFKESIFKCCNFPFSFFFKFLHHSFFITTAKLNIFILFVSLTFFSIVHVLFFWTLHLKSDSYMAIKKVQTRQSRNVLKYDFIEPASTSINAENIFVLEDIQHFITRFNGMFIQVCEFRYQKSYSKTSVFLCMNFFLLSSIPFFFFVEFHSLSYF